MSRALILVAAFALLASVSAREASADGLHLSESFGVSAVGGDLGQAYEGGFFVKVSGGAHIDNFSAELFLAMDELRGKNPAGTYHASARHDAEMLRYGAEARYFIPAARNLRLYVRGGLSGNIVSHSGFGSLRGRGLEYGTGAMYTTKVRALGFVFWPLFFAGVGPKVSLSLWTDLGGNYARLQGDRGGVADVRTSTFSAGFTIGGGF